MSTSPYLRFGVHDAEDLRTVGTAVAWAWLSSYSGRVTVTAVGAAGPAEPADVDAAVRAVLAARPDARSLTVPAASVSAVADLFVGEVSTWSWWWLAEQPPSQPGEDLVAALDGDDPRITGLLEHSSSAYIVPGDSRILGWWGIEAGDGELDACAAEIAASHGSRHIVSVCVHPRARGRRLARALCAAMVRRALAEGAPGVCLEMYADNTAGRAVYRALGFTEVEVLASGWIVDDEPGTVGCGD